MRDQTLPAEQSQLDQLANQLKSALNSVTNGASSVPAPVSLTGTATVSNATALSATGTVRIAVTDKSGSLVSYQDLNLASYSNVGGLATAINSITGVSASVDANGHLTIASTNAADGVAINDMSSSVSGAGFSDYFGMNDIVSGTGASNFAVSSTFLNGAEALPTDTLDSSTTPVVGSQVLAPGSASIIESLHNVLTGSTNFSSAGGLTATRGSFADYASGIVANVASKASQASTAFTAKATAQEAYANSISSESGVNVDEESNRISSLQNKYAAASQLLATINSMFSSLLTAMHS
jgi:flagellar hook-associated protein 1 FlgK